MKNYGDLEILGGGSALNLKIEQLDALPEFNPAQAGRIVFYNVDAAIYVNDGNQWLPLAKTVSGVTPIRTVLGSNWLKSDLTFNPVPFNDLGNIGTFTASDSLFSVIAGISEAISEVGGSELADLDGISINPTDADIGHVLYYNGEYITLININELPGDKKVSVSLKGASDSNIVEPLEGHFLVYKNAQAKFVNKKVNHFYSDNEAKHNHDIQHGLNQRYCNVTVIDLSTKKAIYPDVTFTNANSLTVSLDAAAPIAVNIWAI